MPWRGYKRAIQEATGCPDTDLAVLEGIMRDHNGGTLDSLLPRAFEREAKLAAQVLAYVRDRAPELEDYYRRRGL